MLGAGKKDTQSSSGRSGAPTSSRNNFRFQFQDGLFNARIYSFRQSITQFYVKHSPDLGRQRVR